MATGGASTPPNIQNGLVGNLKVNNFDSGQKATGNTFWRGDGHWHSPAPNYIDVTSFGADPTGSKDSTTAIQNAINSVPATGGDVWFPPGTYKVSSTITIGNGTNSTVSSVHGVHLRGAGGPIVPLWALYPVIGTVTIDWEGGAHGTIFSWVGPMQGWGMHNFTIGSINTTFDVGIKITTCSFGHCENLSIVSAQVAAIWSATWDPFSNYGTADSDGNTFINTAISVPDVNNAKGIYLSGGGQASPTSDTDYCTFFKLIVGIAPASGGHTQTAIYLDVCDTCSFYDVHLQTGGGSNTFGVVNDYSVNSIFPSGNSFYNIDNATTNSWHNTGTPANGSAPHAIYGLPAANQGAYPAVQHIAYDVSMSGGLSFTNQNGAIGATSLFPSNTFTAGMYMVAWYMEATTVDGTSTASFQLQSTNTDDSGSSLSGNLGTALATNVHGVNQGVGCLRVKLGTTPTFNVTSSGSPATSKYALYIRTIRMDSF